jgi:hypothetical protein
MPLLTIFELRIWIRIHLSCAIWARISLTATNIEKKRINKTFEVFPLRQN